RSGFVLWSPQEHLTASICRGICRSNHPPSCSLVHPAFVVGVALAWVVGLDVAAFVVELHVAALLAHVDLKLLCRATALRLVVRIPQAEVLFAEAEGQPTPRREPNVQEAGERARKLDRGSHGSIGPQDNRQRNQ